MNKLYKKAEKAYLALESTSINTAFDSARVSANKIAYVVSRLESISITNNIHDGDLLGEFFEQIVSQDFTQTKGQFFTPAKIVDFMLHLIGAVEGAKKIVRNERDQLGRPRLPYVIDPSCGSGTFLIEYMKLIRQTIGSQDYKKTLPNRVRELHEAWFAGTSGNTWAKDFLFGIENNYDLGLACKVNMVLHGDGSMNTWVKSGILPFDAYWIDGRHNILGTKQIQDNKKIYTCDTNEQFDLVVSNPPFSLKMSPDEQAEVASAFGGSLGFSEVLFIERWYQLLKPNGYFCCILPESILDTTTNQSVRHFMLKHFKLLAIISLPYDTFKPFTSTKTCIVYAQKRTDAFVQKFDKQFSENQKQNTIHDLETILNKTFKQLKVAEETIFMAEPQSVGYKRRKGLSDLPTTNELFTENEKGLVSETQDPNTVLHYFKNLKTIEHNPKLGFTTTLNMVTSRKGLRLDPKYRWLWDYQQGVVLGKRENAIPLGNIVTIKELSKVKKGDLPNTADLIDLESVDSRGCFVNQPIPEVTEIGSDKVVFENVDILFSKLEPYLGKVIVSSETNTKNQLVIGSTEWIGFICNNDFDPVTVAYLLVLPELCDAYRRLQSGKRHARLDPKELIELSIDITISEQKALQIQQKRKAIVETQEHLHEIREEIDNLIKTEIE